LGGHKLTKQEARKITGIRDIKWISEFPRLFHRLMCECDHTYLNSNEHKRAAIEVESREARFVADTMRRYPLHDYHRLARPMHQLRIGSQTSRSHSSGKPAQSRRKGSVVCSVF